MYFLYNLLAVTAGFLLNFAAQFSRKLRLFVAGRRDVIRVLSDKIAASDKTIWVHAASLGEYEQGLPLMEKIKLAYPQHKIILTFFSPSGYEVRKNNQIADVTVYLPLDTARNARRFVEAAHPEMVFFIKYEFWPNYLRQLRNKKIPSYLVSGIFRPDQVFFQWYGGFYRQALRSFSHFFVQNDRSKTLLAEIGFSNVTVSGDTRFDRVASILERDNTLGFIEAFADGKLTVVAGSTWPKDEMLLSDYIDSKSDGTKFIIAPHNIKPEQIRQLRESITRKTVLFSEKEGKELADFEVFIIDTIGILTRIYSYADIAYVGGGFGSPGVHNILEPAAFGVPIVIGPNYSHFAEATALVNMGGCSPVSNLQQLNDVFDRLIHNEDVRNEQGHICGTFVSMNKDAVGKIMKHLGHGRDI